MISARGLAMEVLLTWEKHHAPLDQTLEELCSRYPQLDPRDRQLIMSITYGVMRWQGWLDILLAQLASHPLAKMKPLTRIALRVGLYQLLFLERVPHAAAINETVLALKQARQPKWLTGFVNGVLRQASRDRERFAPPGAEAAVASHPAWLRERWKKLFGRERSRAICVANNQPPPLVLRVETAKVSMADFIHSLQEAGVEALPGIVVPEAVRITGLRGGVTALPGYHGGLFQVQDEAAQLVVPLLAPFAEHGSFLDACAGLGGKTVHLAGLLPASARLTVVEPHAGRLALLAENLRRSGWEAKVFHGDLGRFAQESTEQFQAILVDAPCSGLGVIRRHPEIRWARSLNDLAQYQARQLTLLDCAAGLVAPDGVLVYATCSIDPLENDAVITTFLKRHPEFAATPVQVQLPAAAHALCDENGFLRTPPEQGLDGFFAARLQKKCGR